MGCTLHPRYEGKRKPVSKRAGCTCAAIYAARQGYRPHMSPFTGGSTKAAQDLIETHSRELQRQSEHALKAQLLARQGELAAALAEAETLRQALGLAEAVQAGTSPISIPRRELASGQREGCAVIMASDWHAGETVDPGMVFGKNEYNPEIFRLRAARMAAGAEWLIDLNAKAFRIKDALIWLGGDLMTGFIHEDLAVTNAVGPVDEILLWLDAAEALVRQVARRVDRVVVACSYGNHGRMTPKPRIHSGAMLSLEVLGYKWLADRLRDLKPARKGAPGVTIRVATGEHLYVDVLGWNVRLTHGDAVRYQGGVGGVTIPLKKAIHRWDTALRAHYTLVGHFHQYLDMGPCVVNGSLIGYSPYAVRIAAEWEEPAQGFFVIDSKRGKCQSTPIWCSRKDDPTHVSTHALEQDQAPNPKQGSAAQGRKARSA